MQGEHVWLDRNTKGELPIGALVKVSGTDHIRLVDDDGLEHFISNNNASMIKLMHQTSAHGVDDMVRDTQLKKAKLMIMWI